MNFSLSRWKVAFLSQPQAKAGLISQENQNQEAARTWTRWSDDAPSKESSLTVGPGPIENLKGWIPDSGKLFSHFKIWQFSCSLICWNLIKGYILKINGMQNFLSEKIFAALQREAGFRSSTSGTMKSSGKYWFSSERRKLILHFLSIHKPKTDLKNSNNIFLHYLYIMEYILWIWTYI